MNVVNFPRIELGKPGVWRSSELGHLLPTCCLQAADGADGFAVGSTERGDPQLYVFGAQPDHDCLVCVTRIGNLYVLEDGNGRVIFEHTNLAMIAEKIPATISHRKAAIAAKLVLLWAAFRHTVEEKIEPMLAEPLEIATHLMPQIAAFG
jgi:hypothetical protein